MSSNKVKGIMCIISSAFCFALMNMFVRMAGDLPSIQKSFFRNFIALIIAFIVLIRTDEKFKFNKKKNQKASYEISSINNSVTQSYIVHKCKQYNYDTFM